MKLSKVKPNPNNPRIIKDDKFKKLVKSINDFPKMLALRPIVVDENFIVQGGNMRLKALQEIGFKDIPDEWVKQVKDLSEDEKKQFIIKDNVGFGEWDWDDLANNWDAEQLTEWGLDIPNFEAEVLEAEEDNYSIPDEIKTDIVLGDLFEIGEHRLLCGDSTDSDQVAKLMNGQKADMVLTDPPYGINEETDRVFASRTRLAKGNKFDKILGDESTEVAIKAIEIIKSLDIKVQVIWGANYYAHHLPESANWLVWDKRVEEKQRDMNSDAELAWVKSNKNSVRIFRHLWKGMIKESEHGQARVHPTQKPIALADWCINEYAKESKTILDLFLGSGSTMVASHQLKRKCYGMELDPNYCQVIVDRMLKLDPSLIVKRNGKPYEATH
jgi:DNA modification methylase